MECTLQETIAMVGSIVDCVVRCIVLFLGSDFMRIDILLPNQSPEPTARAAAVCAREVPVRHAAVTRWLSFFR
jgi:hypothetical protein